MREFFSTPKVATALHLVDYSDAILAVDGSVATTQPWSRFDDALLTSALAVHTDLPGEMEGFDANQMMVREAFDELLTAFERFEHYVQTDLVSIDDLKVYLRYWIDKLANPGSEWKPLEFYVALHRFIRAYQYSAVEKLFERFGYRLLD